MIHSDEGESKPDTKTTENNEPDARVKALQLGEISVKQKPVNRRQSAFRLSLFSSDTVWSIATPKRETPVWRAFTSVFFVSLVFPTAMFAMNYMLIVDIHSDLTDITNWSTIACYFQLCFISVAVGFFPFFFNRALLRLDVPLTLLNCWPPFLYAAQSLLQTYVLIHFFKPFPIPFRTFPNATVFAVLIPLSWYVTLPKHIKAQRDFFKVWIVASIIAMGVAVYFCLCLGYTFCFILASYIEGSWLGSLAQIGVMAVFQMASIGFKKAAIGVVFNAYDLHTQVMSEDEVELNERRARFYQASLVSVMLIFMIELSEEMFIIFIMPEASDVSTIVITLLIAAVAVVKEGAFLDNTLKDVLVKNQALVKVIQLFESSGTDVRTRSVDAGMIIDTRRQHLLLAMLVIADIFADFSSLVLLPVCYYGPASRFYSMSRAPEASIIATVLLSAGEIAVLAIVSIVLCNRIERQTGTHPMKEAIMLLYNNQSFLLSVMGCAMIFPSCALGEQWQTVWWVKSTLDNIFGRTDAA